jgi:hypothetical protein
VSEQERNEEMKRRLEAAGWEPEEREGVTIWRDPETGLWYDQEKAMTLLQEGLDPGSAD